MSNLSSGKLWPIAIALAITMVFGFGVATVIVTGKADIQPSDRYMTYYQDADAKANDLIKARIKFDKKYKISYISDGIATGKTVSYKLTDVEGNPINNAKIILATSRPETKVFDQRLNEPQVKDGVYTFDGLKFPKAGVWNLEAKITVADKSRFYNIKADTRTTNSYEF